MGLEQIFAQVLALDLLFLHVSWNRPQICDSNHTHTHTVNLLQKGHTVSPCFIFYFMLFFLLVSLSLFLSSLRARCARCAPIGRFDLLLNACRG